jgi:hypothetical protein
LFICKIYVALTTLLLTLYQHVASCRADTRTVFSEKRYHLSVFARYGTSYPCYLLSIHYVYINTDATIVIYMRSYGSIVPYRRRCCILITHTLRTPIRMYSYERLGLGIYRLSPARSGDRLSPARSGDRLGIKKKRYLLGIKRRRLFLTTGPKSTRTLCNCLLLFYYTLFLYPMTVGTVFVRLVALYSFNRCVYLGIETMIRA